VNAPTTSPAPGQASDLDREPGPARIRAGQPHTPARRREWQPEQTRLDLALAAFSLAQEHGLANARVPQIARGGGCVHTHLQ
jgi:hypothetical protein